MVHVLRSQEGTTIFSAYILYEGYTYLPLVYAHFLHFLISGNIFFKLGYNCLHSLNILTGASKITEYLYFDFNLFPQASGNE